VAEGRRVIEHIGIEGWKTGAGPVSPVPEASRKGTAESVHRRSASGPPASRAATKPGQHGSPGAAIGDLLNSVPGVLVVHVPVDPAMVVRIQAFQSGLVSSHVVLKIRQIVAGSLVLLLNGIAPGSINDCTRRLRLCLWLKAKS